MSKKNAAFSYYYTYIFHKRNNSRTKDYGNSSKGGGAVSLS
jgi:hypothetical protein